MLKTLFAIALISTSAAGAYAGTTSDDRTPAEVLADKFRAMCTKAGGKFVLAPDVITSTRSIRSENSFDFQIDGAGVRCRGVAGWNVPSGIYSDEARLLVDDVAEMEVIGDSPPRVVYTRSGPECRGAKTCKIWKVWDGEKLVPEPIDYAVTTTPPTARAPVLKADGQNGGYDHNGSAVSIDIDAGQIVYRHPKPAIAGTVKPGQVMFVGTFGKDATENGSIEGVAFTFKKGCAPAPYNVRGSRLDGWRTRLAGEAPIRDPKGCTVIGYTRESPNALLIFDRSE